VSSSYGYSKGFDAYYEVWKDQSVKGEDAGARKLTDEALRFLSGTKAEQPYFLWVHYVNPHAPYTPPAPYNKAFLDAESQRGPRLAPVDGFHDGIFRKWYVPGQDKLGYYIAQYDGEIAFVDNEVRRVLEGIKRTGRQDRTLIILTSDHGESLGEHGYYFDHGEDLFDPCLRIPLIVSGPGIPKGKRSQVMTSTLDLVPTILDTVKVSYPPDLSGLSVLAAMTQDGPLARQRLAAENDRGLRGLHDERYKIVDRPGEQGARRLALYDRQSDPGELRDLGARSADVMRRQRRELELFFEVRDREWSATRRRVEGVPEGVGDQMSKEECERLRSLGYISQQCE
jgi:arylsulfatase A-like enzyme